MKLCVGIVPFSSYSKSFVESGQFSPTPPAPDPVRIWQRYLALENWSPCAIVWRYLGDPKVSHFDTIPACDGRTDRQTDRQTDAQTHDDSVYCVRIASRGENKLSWTRRSSVYNDIFHLCFHACDSQQTIHVTPIWARKYVIVRPLSTVEYTSVTSVFHSIQWSN